MRIEHVFLTNVYVFRVIGHDAARSFESSWLHSKFVFQPSATGLDLLQMSAFTDERVTSFLNSRAHTLIYVNIEPFNRRENSSSSETKQINQRPKAEDDEANAPHETGWDPMRPKTGSGLKYTTRSYNHPQTSIYTVLFASNLFSIKGEEVGKSWPSS